MRAVLIFFVTDKPVHKVQSAVNTFGNWMIAEVFLMARVSPGNTLSNVVTLSSNVVTFSRAESGRGSRSEVDRRCVAGLSYEETMEF